MTTMKSVATTESWSRIFTGRTADAPFVARTALSMQWQALAAS